MRERKREHAHLEEIKAWLTAGRRTFLNIPCTAFNSEGINILRGLANRGPIKSRTAARDTDAELERVKSNDGATTEVLERI